MLSLLNFESLKEKLLNSWYFVLAIIMAIAGLAPVLIQDNVAAQQLTSRSLTLSSSADGATANGQNVTYTFEFDIATTGNIGSMQFLFCTTPLGTCTAPTGMDASGTTLGTNTINAVAGGFALGTAGNAPTANQIRIGRTPASATAGHTAVITFNDIDNPDLSGNGTSFYARITTYSDSYTTTVDEGTVAGAIVDQLTVTGRVQERLVFCVYALDDTAGSGAAGAGSGAMPENCAATEANNGAEVDLGVIDNLTIATSPVDNSPPSSLGNDTFGAAQVNTNASNGVVLGYYATAASTGTEELRAFRVPGATCVNGGTDTQDQCFISANESTGETFSAGTERFGIQIACVANNDTAGSGLGLTSNLGSGGTGAGTGGTYNTVYSNTDNNIDDDGSDDCENSDAGVKFAWNDTSTTQALVSSSSVVDDEIVKLRFGAAAAATTPTGAYTASATMIATATF